MNNRRNFLKSVGLSAVVANASLLAGCGVGNGSKKRIHLTLPALVGSSRDGVQDDFILELPSGERVPMVAHDEVSIALLRSGQPVMAGASSTSMAASYFADATALPVRTPGVLRILKQPKVSQTGHASLYLTSIYSPSAEQANDHALRVDTLRSQMGLPIRTAGAMVGELQRSTDTDEFLTPHSTAIAIVYHHPELMSLDPLQASVIKAHIEASPYLGDLVTAISNQPTSSIDGPMWCRTVLVTDDETGEPVLYSDGSRIYDYRVSDDIMALAGLVMSDALRTVKADTLLQDKTWSTSDGIASRTLQTSAPMASSGEGYDIASSMAEGQRQGGVTFSCRMVDPAKRTIEVVMRNSFIRIGGVYVEFIDAAGHAQKVDTDIWANALKTRLSYPTRNAKTDWLFYPDGGRSALLSVLLETSVFMGIPVRDRESIHLITLPDAYTGLRLKVGTLGYDTIPWDIGNPNPFDADSTLGGLYVGSPVNGVKFTEYLIGALSTALGDMAIPVIYLASGVGMRQDVLWKTLFYDPDFMLSVVSIIFSTSIELNIINNADKYTQAEVDRAKTNLGSNWRNLLTKLADRLLKFLFKSTGGAMLMAHLTADILGAQIVGSIPFIGWALRAAAVISTAARLAQTTVECLSSSGAIVNTIQLSLDLRLTINPDLNDLVFPTGAKYYRIQLQKDQTTFYQTDWKLVSGDRSITETFRKIPSCGTVKAYVVFCDKPYGDILGKGLAARYKLTVEAISLLKLGRANYDALPASVADKLAPMIGNVYTTTPSLVEALEIYLGHADTNTYRKAIAGMLADHAIPLLLMDTATLVDMECTIERQLTPLTAATIYKHDQILDFVGNNYLWKTTSTAPMVAGRAALEPRGITLAQRSGQIGYVWRSLDGSVPVCGYGDPSDQVYTAQNVSSGTNPNSKLKRMSQLNIACGVTEGVGLYYKLMGDTDGNGENFLLEGSLDALHVRPIPINATDPREPWLSLDIRRPSYGTFHRMPTAVVWHPGNYLVGVHASLHKLEVLNLNNGLAMHDTDAQAAHLLGGLGMRPGLLRGPTCVASTLSGAVLVLESIANRVQALDIHGSPIPYFPSTLSSPYFFELYPYGNTVTYLDMGVEATGFIYVLSHTGNGQQSTDYNLDIYSPGGVRVSHTNGFTAARIAVDLWRTVYTLNWQTLQGLGGRPEPTLSRWRPFN